VEWLDVPIAPDEAIALCSSAGISAGKVFGVRGGVRKKLHVDFAVAPRWKSHILHQNLGHRVAYQINLTDFACQLRGDFEPIWSLCVIRSARPNPDALHGDKNMFYAGGCRTDFANWRFERNHAHCCLGLRERTNGRRISCFYAIIENGDKTRIAATSKPGGGEQRNAIERIQEITSRGPRELGTGPSHSTLRRPYSEPNG
jgi:hypothetical protein